VSGFFVLEPPDHLGRSKISDPDVSGRALGLPVMRTKRIEKPNLSSAGQEELPKANKNWDATFFRSQSHLQKTNLKPQPVRAELPDLWRK
jgi:hypothetical protein